MAFQDDPSAEDGVNLIAIEAQAIDIRGGSVGPAWQAWEEGKVEDWRTYFTEDAKRRNKPDKITYGVNAGNVYKRLATQVSVKGEFFHSLNIPLYVVMQHRILRQLRARVNFETVQPGQAWDITFVSFDYTDRFNADGSLKFTFIEAARTTLANYIRAFTRSNESSTHKRIDLIQKMKRKAARNGEDIILGDNGRRQIPGRLF